MNFKVDFCSYEAAKYSVINWHYSQTMPVGKLFKIGVWENDKFIGVVLFGRGANNNMLKPYKLEQIEGCELVRVALKSHKTPVTKIVSIAIKLLKKTNPKLKLIVSYADTGQNHLGVIYQAGNWIYTGINNKITEMKINGKREHSRSISAKYGTCDVMQLREKGLDAERVESTSKHRYLMPLTKEMRKQIELLKKPYPKKENICVSGVKSSTSGDQLEGGGAVPTDTLHIKS